MGERQTESFIFKYENGPRNGNSRNLEMTSKNQFEKRRNDL